MDRSIWLAAAFSFGLCSASFAQISGKVTLQGTLPDMRQIKEMSAIPQCAQLHGRAARVIEGCMGAGRERVLVQY